MAAPPPSLEDQLRALVLRASQLPSPLLHSIPPVGTSLLASYTHTSNFISASITFINQSLQLINDLSSSTQLLFSHNTSQAGGEFIHPDQTAATESGTSILLHQGAAGPAGGAAVIDEEMRKEALRNARETSDRFEQMEEKSKDSNGKKNEGNKSPKKGKPSADDGGRRGGTSSGINSSGRVRRRSDSNEGVTIHFPGENPENFDGYMWRKYGEKNIYGKEKRRGYYRCKLRDENGCEAKKRVQACEAACEGYLITYINDHTCGSGSVMNNPMIAGAVLGRRRTCADLRRSTSGRNLNIDLSCQPSMPHLANCNVDGSNASRIDESRSTPLLAHCNVDGGIDNASSIDASRNMPLLAHFTIDGANTSSSPDRCNQLADPHCSINGANNSSPYHCNLLQYNTTVTTPPTTTAVSTITTTTTTTAAAIANDINALTLYGGETATSILSPFLNYRVIGLDHIEQPAAYSQDRLESPNSSTLSSSKHSSDEYPEVAFPITGDDTTTSYSAKQISVKHHRSSDGHQLAQLSTAFISEAHSFEPSVDDFDDIMLFDSWP